MFSPDAVPNIQHITRNPRRRQRSGDSVFQQNVKRQRRSKLSSDTFVPPEHKLNGYATGHANGSAHGDAGVDISRLAIRQGSVGRRELEPGRRAERGIELTKNEFYEVNRLPSTPDQLEDPSKSGRWQCHLSSSQGYAVATTSDHAFVWRYAQGHGPGESTKLSTIRLLHPSTKASDPLPFASLVSSSGQPGVLIVMPTSGKVTYWEDIPAAAAVDSNRQRMQGVQGKIGLMSGESVTSVVEAEPLGFALACSSGRVAHLTIGDVSSKSAISVDFLQVPSILNAGYFSSFSGLLLGSGRTREIAAIRSGASSQRGQRQVVIATTNCRFEAWDFRWNKTQSMMYMVDAREDIMTALVAGGDILYTQDNHDLHVLDFTFLPAASKRQDIVRPNDKGAFDILALTSFEHGGSVKYNLVCLTLSDGTASIRVIHPISCYTTAQSQDISFRPRVLVPEPGHTAFVAFQRGIALISLAEVPVSADAQLMAEADALEPPFQDVLDFRKDRNYAVAGCTSEAADKHHEKASCVFAVHNYGLVRVTALPLKRGQDAADRARITAKTKLEQAVFYGCLDQNLFDFSSRPEINFKVEEVDKAARDISLAICKSSSDDLPQVTPSTEQQLQRRAEALSDLIKNLRKHYPRLPPSTRMVLLQHAERMASARAMFKTYSAELARSSSSQSLLPEAVEMLNQNYKKENQPDSGETDNVRHWLIHDVWRFERLAPWLAEAVHVLQKESVEDETPLNSETMVRLYTEACEETLAIIETAFRFREANFALYGFDKEAQVDGVLLPGYDVQMPSFWTSTNLEKLKQLADESMALASEEFERRQSDSPEVQNEEGFASTENVTRLIDLLPRIVEICTQARRERLHMFKSKKAHIPDAEKIINQATSDISDIELSLMTKLSALGIGIKGVQLAEKYRNMPALVEIIEMEKIEQNATMLQPGCSEEERDFAFDNLEILDTKTKDYFISFGKAFADAFFDRAMRAARTGDILVKSRAWQKHLTDYLRRNIQRFAKITWINEILAENQYHRAAVMLNDIQKDEESFWNKKVQSSLSKLCFLAALEKQQTTPAKAAPDIAELDTISATLKYQVALQDYIRHSTADAIDATAAKAIAYSTFGTKNVKGKQILTFRLHSILDSLVDRKILDAFELIDALTLIDIPRFDSAPVQDEDNQHPMPSARFYIALLVAHASNLDLASLSLTESIIWRRCMIADPWPTLNRTELKSDNQVSEALRNTALYATLYYGFRDDGFWERRSRPLPPETVAGTGGISVEQLKEARRFENVHDEILLGLSKDLNIENKELAKMVEKGRLGIWFKGCLDAARESVKEEREEELRGIEHTQGDEVRQNPCGQRRDMERDGEGDVLMEE